MQSHIDDHPQRQVDALLLEGSCAHNGLHHGKELTLWVLDNKDRVVVDQKEWKQVLLINHRGQRNNFYAFRP